MIAVKTLDVTQDFKSIAERIMQGEKVLISRPKNENIVMITEEEYNRLDEIWQKAQRKLAGEQFIETLKEMREQSVINGTSDMTLDEINEIIAEVRQEEKG